VISVFAIPPTIPHINYF